VMGRRGIRCKPLLGDDNEKIGYWKLKGEELDRTARRTRIGRGCGAVKSQVQNLSRCSSYVTSSKS
jgi:hypothetical protein